MPKAARIAPTADARFRRFSKSFKSAATNAASSLRRFAFAFSEVIVAARSAFNCAWAEAESAAERFTPIEACKSADKLAISAALAESDALAESEPLADAESPAPGRPAAMLIAASKLAEMGGTSPLVLGIPASAAANELSFAEQKQGMEIVPR